jgi:hypothetical protein
MESRCCTIDTPSQVLLLGSHTSCSLYQTRPKSSLYFFPTQPAREPIVRLGAPASCCHDPGGACAAAPPPQQAKRATAALRHVPLALTSRRRATGTESLICAFPARAQRPLHKAAPSAASERGKALGNNIQLLSPTITITTI